MRIDEFRPLSSNNLAAEITETTLEGRGITLRLEDIQAVAEELTDVRSEIYDGDRCRIYTGDLDVVVRNTKAAVVASITALGGFVETIVLTTYLGREVEIRAEKVFGVSEGIADIRDPIYTGIRSFVQFGQIHMIQVRTNAAAVLALIAATAQRFSNYARVEDQKPALTNAGTFTSGAFRTRDLNTVVQDDDGLVSLAINQITLEDGQYYLAARAPATSVIAHAARWQNIPDAVTELESQSERVQNSVYTTTQAHVDGIFTVTGGPKAYELQHRCSLTIALAGFGFNTGFNSTEVYSVVELWKIGA
jgi:hypothetical protein